MQQCSNGAIALLHYGQCSSAVVQYIYILHYTTYTNDQTRERETR